MVNADFAYLAVPRFANLAHAPAMAKDSKPTQVPNRIKEIRTRLGVTLDELAERTQLSTTYLNRMENLQRNVSMKNLAAIAKGLNVAQADLLEAAKPSGTIMVKGHVQAGLWTDDPEWPEPEWYQVSVPDHPLYPRGEKHASEVRGPSMNRVYPPGTILIWLSIYDDGESLESGRRYIVRRTSEDGRYEITVKTLQSDSEGRMWLVPESDHPAYQSPIEFRSDGTQVEILGRVIQSVRFE